MTNKTPQPRKKHTGEKGRSSGEFAVRFRRDADFLRLGDDRTSAEDDVQVVIHLATESETMKTACCKKSRFALPLIDVVTEDISIVTCQREPLDPGAAAAAIDHRRQSERIRRIAQRRRD